jgi:hypothetical protein
MGRKLQFVKSKYNGDNMHDFSSCHDCKKKFKETGDLRYDNVNPKAVIGRLCAKCLNKRIAKRLAVIVDKHPDENGQMELVLPYRGESHNVKDLLAALGGTAKCKTTVVAVREIVLDVEKVGIVSKSLLDNGYQIKKIEDAGEDKLYIRAEDVKSQNGAI